VVVGAESQYADVLRQVGGRDVSVAAVESNPAIDPHSFQISPHVAQEVSEAQIVVQNGLGYDSFMDRVEAVAPSSGRTVIDVQTLLKLPDSTPNPHLWYQPATMPAVASAVADALSRLRPADASYFQANARRFTASLGAWRAELAKIATDFPQAPVATTDPLADYLLQAAGADIKTPYSLQAALMNGTDPTPQDLSRQDALFADHQVAAFVYNRQVTDPTTESFLASARASNIPVVGMSETMPASAGTDFQSWMLAQTTALYDALSAGAPAAQS
jgi:zinc/manganese transport system substrate-binding protein